jgi:hypothetical protein
MALSETWKPAVLSAAGRNGRRGSFVLIFNMYERIKLRIVQTPFMNPLFRSQT